MSQKSGFIFEGFPNVHSNTVTFPLTTNIYINNKPLTFVLLGDNILLVHILPNDFCLVYGNKFRFSKNVATAIGRNFTWNFDDFKVYTDAISC